MNRDIFEVIRYKNLYSHKNIIAVYRDEIPTKDSHVRQKLLTDTDQN